MKRTLTTTEAANIFGVAKQTIDSWLKYGVLRRVKIGDKSYITGASVQLLIRQFDDIIGLAKTVEKYKEEVKSQKRELELHIRTIEAAKNESLLRYAFYSDSTSWGISRILSELFAILSDKKEFTDKILSVIRSFTEGRNLVEIAATHNCTEERVRQILKQSCKLLYELPKYTDLVKENARLENLIKLITNKCQSEEPKCTQDFVFDDIPIELLNILSTKISEIGFSNRTSHALSGYGISQVSDLIRRSRMELSRIRNIGRLCMDEIDDFISKNHLCYDVDSIDNSFVENWKKQYEGITILTKNHNGKSEQHRQAGYQDIP